MGHHNHTLKALLEEGEDRTALKWADVIAMVQHLGGEDHRTGNDDDVKLHLGHISRVFVHHGRELDDVERDQLRTFVKDAGFADLA